MNKKSQFEIIGLVFIVALISVGLLLVFYLVSTQKTDSPRETFRSKTFAYDTLIVMEKITLPCRASSQQTLFLDELVADCGKGGGLYCDAVDLDSCDYSKAIIINVLNATLERFHYPYYFVAEKMGYNQSFGGCTARSSGHPGIVAVPIGDGSSVIMSLKICDKFINTG